MSVADIQRRAEAALALLDAQAPQDGSSDWLHEATRIAALYVPPETGRPSDALIDVQRVGKVLRLVAEGNYIETACRAAGISKDTLYTWRKHAERGDIAAIAFTDALEKAQAEAEADAVSHIRSTRKRPELWAASMTHLERRHPDRWGKRADDTSVPKIVVQIGARDSDVSVSVGSIIETRTSEIESTPVVATSYIESTQVTERRLSDVDTVRSKVTAPRTTRTQTATGSRRRNRVGLQPGRRAAIGPDGAE